MRSWCMRHPIGFMALYLVFYLAFFFLLDRAVTPVWWVHCALDDVIPFCKYAIIPYVIWFAWVPLTLLFLLWRAPRQEFWRLCLPLFLGMTLALLFCAIVPNGVHLRPRFVPGQDVFAVAVRLLYRSDTSTNVCPSIHVFSAVMVTLAWQRTNSLPGWLLRVVRPAALVLGASIVLSTMLLKQHSAVDVCLGLLLAFGHGSFGSPSPGTAARSKATPPAGAAVTFVWFTPTALLQSLPVLLPCAAALFLAKPCLSPAERFFSTPINAAGPARVNPVRGLSLRQKSGKRHKMRFLPPFFGYGTVPGTPLPGPATQVPPVTARTPRSPAK